MANLALFARGILRLGYPISWVTAPAYNRISFAFIRVHLRFQAGTSRKNPKQPEMTLFWLKIAKIGPKIAFWAVRRRQGLWWTSKRSGFRCSWPRWGRPEEKQPMPRRDSPGLTEAGYREARHRAFPTRNQICTRNRNPNRSRNRIPPTGFMASSRFVSSRFDEWPADIGARPQKQAIDDD